MDEVIVVTKIRFAEEIRSNEDVETPSLDKISKKELDVGMALIDQYSSPFDIKGFHDEYSKELLRIIKAKAKGKRATVKKLKPREEPSDDLYGQLMKSLGGKKKGA